MISEVRNEDCMVMMARYPDKFFDLAIVDVSYGIKQDGRNNHTRGGKTKFGDKMGKNGSYVPPKDYRKYSKYDDTCPDEYYFSELIRVSQNQILFGANHFISKVPFDSSCWLVWDKRNQGSDFADCELAYTSFKTAVRIFRYKWNGMLQEDMANKEERIHPNQKPVALYEFCLQYAKPGDKILDTHLGSGSSRIAAYKLGFDFYGCELDKDYFEAQEKRFAKAIHEPLFQTQPEPVQSKLL